MAGTREGNIKTAARKCGLSVEEYSVRIGAGLKRCTCCKKWKTTDRFGTDRSRWDQRKTKCFDCSRVEEPRTTKGRISTFKGRAHTAEARAVMSAMRAGKPNLARLGATVTPEARAKISAAVRKNGKRGPDHYAWKDGSRERQKCDRRRPEYQDWRSAVFQRDAFTCQKCGDAKGGNLRAHHIKPYADFPDLRLDIGNGITLCHDCHELEHYKPNSTRNLRKAKRGKSLF